MALRTFQYAGNKKWTGQLSFCGQSFNLTVECLGTDWRVTCGEHQRTIPSGLVDRVQIDDKWYLDFTSGWLPEEIGLNRQMCPNPVGLTAVSAKIYIPAGDINCGGSE